MHVTTLICNSSNCLTVIDKRSGTKGQQLPPEVGCGFALNSEQTSQNTSSAALFSLSNFSSEHLNSCVSYFSRPISRNPQLWWQATGWAAAERRWLAGVTIPPLAVLHTHTPIQKTCIWCVCVCVEAVSLWLLLEDEDRSRLACCPFDLRRWIPSSPMCPPTAWRETSVTHHTCWLRLLSFCYSLSLSASTISLSFFSSFSLHCLFFSLIFHSLSSFFCSVISQVPSWGENLLSSLEHTCSPIKSRCICLSKTSLSSLFLPSE